MLHPIIEQFGLRTDTETVLQLYTSVHRKRNPIPLFRSFVIRLASLARPSMLFHSVHTVQTVTFRHSPALARPMLFRLFIRSPPVPAALRASATRKGEAPVSAVGWNSAIGTSRAART